jgi:hypothetical protein
LSQPVKQNTPLSLFFQEQKMACTKKRRGIAPSDKLNRQQAPDPFFSPEHVA